MVLLLAFFRKYSISFLKILKLTNFSLWFLVIYVQSWNRMSKIESFKFPKTESVKQSHFPSSFNKTMFFCYFTQNFILSRRVIHQVGDNTNLLSNNISKIVKANRTFTGISWRSIQKIIAKNILENTIE